MNRAYFTTILVLIGFMVTVAINGPASATDPEIVLADPILEARAKAITQQLRCPTCVSQSVDDSNVGISQDLQRLVRERIIAGDSDREILDYVASRYGDFVLLKPRTRGVNLVLWSLPALLFVGSVVGFIVLRRKNAGLATAPVPLTDDEQAAINALVDNERS